MSELESTRLTWHLIVTLAALAGGFVWLGSESRQIDVNTTRVDRLELSSTLGYERDVNATARIIALERRLDALEHLSR